ncbi:hypothetical protein B0H17DRAFT_1078671 [Mycena rosella]|uniref:SH3 domain-containing protein n=1 Tax=Mycena rosella TaxID=1033263 RepID=A0AAD7D4T9_MYCRO|nr:hypothetical protein B0H17DRAFT_1078671 [Mycena rosella]
MDSSVAHIVAQTRQNVDFLISQRHISPEDGRNILAKLPQPDRSMAALEQQAQNLMITPPPSAPPRGPSYPGPPHLRRYNEGQNPNDLSFRAGDTIEIVEETNMDWWTGRHNGRQEMAPPPGPPSPYQTRDSTYSPGGPSFPNQGAPYQPPPGAYSGPGYQPPPPGPGGYQPPPPGLPPQAPAPAAPPEQPPKKGKFGGNLGNTLAQSAVGGVGFGAGSAVGSGIINAIF